MICCLTVVHIETESEVILVGKAKVLKNIVLPTFSEVQLTPADSVKGLGVILDQTLLLKKQVNAAAKMSFTFRWLPTLIQLIWPHGSKLW